MLKNGPICLAVYIENESMITTTVHQYWRCLVATTAYNDVLHFRNQPLDTPDELILVSLENKIKFVITLHIALAYTLAYNTALA